LKPGVAELKENALDVYLDVMIDLVEYGVGMTNYLTSAMFCAV
jgi:hypothetical protein